MVKRYGHFWAMYEHATLIFQLLRDNHAHQAVQEKINYIRNITTLNATYIHSAISTCQVTISDYQNIYLLGV